MKLWTFLVLTTVFWGMAAILTSLLSGKSPLYRDDGAAVYSHRHPAFGRGDDRANRKHGPPGCAFGYLFRPERDLRRGRRSLDVLSRSPPRRGIPCGAITATYPLITVLLSWLILQEGLTLSRVMGTA